MSGVLVLGAETSCALTCTQSAEDEIYRGGGDGDGDGGDIAGDIVEEMIVGITMGVAVCLM